MACPSQGMRVDNLVITQQITSSRWQRVRTGGVQDQKVCRSNSFAPVAVEALGVWGAEAEKLLEELGRPTVDLTQETRSKFFLKQQIDVAIQRRYALFHLETKTKGETKPNGLSVP